jgi:hypothetical protein
MSLRLLGLFAIVFLANSTIVSAAEPASQPKVIRLAITPAVEPVPALKYQLLPTFYHRRPGNAALDYGRAVASQAQLLGGSLEFETEWNKWLDLPLDEFRKTIAGRDLSSLRSAGGLELARLGARCEHCDWQLPLREQPFYLIHLPQLQEMRRLARLVAINVRLNVIEGRYDEAVELLQTGYAMARHASSEPTLVSGLVGIAIANIMDQARLDLVQSRDAPSFYWAEVFLPRPFIHSRPGIEAEMYAMALSFPALRDEKRTPEEWAAAAQQLLTELPPLMAMSSEQGQNQKHWTDQLSTVLTMGKVAVRRDELRAFIAASGRKQPEVEKMSDPQLLLEFTRLKYEQMRDDMFRWLALPYAEVRPQLEAAERQLVDAKKNSTEILPLATNILPAVASVAHTYARAERRRDVLRIVEALRLYLTKHDGTLPKSLDQITEVPVPKVDVVTGKPLGYVVEGGTARLTLPEENRSDKAAIVYEITAAK